MKRLFIYFTSVLFGVLPTVVFAHTELSSSYPESGQVITDEMKEINLSFAGEIEALSTMSLMKDGQEINFTSVQTQGNQLVGVLDQPLKSGSYLLNWNIAGEDGHPITGEIPFVVQLPNEEKSEQVEEPVQEEKIHNEHVNVSLSENTSNNHIRKIVIPGVVLLLLIIGMVTLFRKKI
ncbi:copper resistance CopC family protein [Robertmurraya korlensis]|uniref:copper resistance CopC family protein n=1 Tax=Robertmurraya korlensis TaxID=519977 RepID=UPI0008259D7E|nr:copper resistance protein CopC [Robertmurraya korlensis]